MTVEGCSDVIQVCRGRRSLGDMPLNAAARAVFIHHHHHHHHRVARPWQDIAVSTSFRHLERSCACFHAELKPRLCCWRSSSIVRSQVRLGRPGGRRQSTGRRLMAARRARASGLGMDQHEQCVRTDAAVWS